MRLPLPMVGILPQDNDFYFMQWSMGKGIEDFVASRIYGLTRLFLGQQKRSQSGHVRLLKLRRQLRKPGALKLHGSGLA